MSGISRVDVEMFKNVCAVCATYAAGQLALSTNLRRRGTEETAAPDVAALAAEDGSTIARSHIA